MTPRIELQLGLVRDRAESLRILWSRECDRRCRPPVEEDIEILIRELADLRTMICQPSTGPLSDSLRHALAYARNLRELLIAHDRKTLADETAIERELRRIEASVAHVLGAIGG